MELAVVLDFLIGDEEERNQVGKVPHWQVGNWFSPSQSTLVAERHALATCVMAKSTAGEPPRVHARKCISRWEAAHAQLYK